MPVFRLLLGAVAVGVVIAASLHFISEGRRLGAERDRREAAAARARTRARQAKEQIPRHARLVGPAAAGATVEQLTARRHRIVNALEVAITGDARRRYRVHAFESRVLHTTCVPFSRSSASPPPEPPLRAASGKYECNAATAEIPRTERAAAGEIGYPFWARVDYRRGTATWCKINPLPGERGIGGEVFVQLAPACDLFRG